MSSEKAFDRATPISDGICSTLRALREDHPAGKCFRRSLRDLERAHGPPVFVCRLLSVAIPGTLWIFRVDIPAEPKKKKKKKGPLQPNPTEEENGSSKEG